MSYPDPNEAVPMSSRKKWTLSLLFLTVVSFVAYGIMTRPPSMTEQMRAERCAVYQGALPEVASMHYRLLDGLKVQVISTRFVYKPDRYNPLKNVDSFCDYSIMVRVEGHNRRAGMKLFEFGAGVE